MAIKFFAFFFPTISTFGCFWSQWPTSLAVTSGREGVRTTSFKPWRPHRGSCRGATAIEENNGSRREQWLTSLTVWTVHSICTYMIFIYIYIDMIYLSIYLSVYLSLSILVGRHLCQCGASRQQRCGAGGCRREATWIMKFSRNRYVSQLKNQPFFLLLLHNNTRPWGCVTKKNTCVIMCS